MILRPRYIIALISGLGFGLNPGLPDSLQADIFDEIDEPTELVAQSSQQLQEEFRKYVEQQNAGINAYEEQIRKEFELYKKIILEERARYEAEVAKQWDDPVLSSKKVWVDYSPDLNQRRSVDFEKETITIEVKVEAGDAQAVSEEVLREILTEIVTKNQAEAFQEDDIAQAVEKRGKQEIEHFVTGDVEPEPILWGYLMGAVEATVQAVQEIVEEIVDYMLDNKEVVTVTDAAGRTIEKAVMPLSVPPKVAERQAKAVTSATARRLPVKAQPFLADVERYAQVKRLEQALVFAVIETESTFNPEAISWIPAYGLMQIVPKYAGKDATKKLRGKEEVLSPSYLYNPEQNIEIGTTYLNILYYDYLSKIENPLSRLYCVIAAYNGGAGNVAKAFSGELNIAKAIPNINRLEPSEVYENLRGHLPHKETRDYLVKVHDRMKEYEAMGL